MSQAADRRLRDTSCPNCGQVVPAAARFCSNCGSHLPGTGASHILPKDLPSGAPVAGQSGPGANVKLEGERKLVTALFADIVGSTALAEAMDPEDWRDVVTGAHRRVSEAVLRYGGTIAQLLGDGVLALFGAPQAHEDDAERATRAALEILASIGEYARDLSRQGIPDLRMRIGLNSGLVVAGQVDAGAHVEYLAVGDTVNLAARMQAAAAPDTALVSESTHRLVADLFDFVDLGRIEVKGKSEPVQVYQVAGARKGAVRTRGIAGLHSPLVGREQESRILDRLTYELAEGRGGLVTVVGEAGLGKSRLLLEWKARVQLRRLPASGQGQIRWVEGRCLSFGLAMAYHLAIDLLRALIAAPVRASAEDPAEEEKTWAALRRAVPETADGEEIRAFLGHLLGLRLAPDAALRIRYLDGAALLSHYSRALCSLVRSLAAEGPLVVICEDVHWADPSSVALLVDVLALAREVPAVFGFVSRPDPLAPGWRLVGEAISHGAVELDITPLDDSHSQQLVDNLLEVAALPEQVRALILAKAEGNPFYVEEVVRMLIDEGVLAHRGDTWTVTRDVQALEIPDTVQGVIMARIDRLPEEEKRMLQIASVIGRRFQPGVLELVLRGEREAR